MLHTGHRGVTKVLVEAGANLEAKTTSGIFVGNAYVDEGATAIIIAAAGGFE